MRMVMVAAATGLIVALFLTPPWVRWLRAKGYSQSIRDADELGYAVPDHASKAGTPSMGGVVIVIATVAGYAAAHLYVRTGPSATVMCVLFLIVGLAAVGFADDYIKVFRRRSTGLRAKTKLVGQAVVAIVFALLVLHFPNVDGVTPGSQYLSFLRASVIFLPIGVYVLWIWFIVSASSNAVNISDGLDGMATGAASLIFGAYAAIGLWQYGRSCVRFPANSCYDVRNPLDLAILAAALAAACIGFLWWNTSPAKIWMGDTGSLAIGGAMAGIAVTSQTELLLPIMAGAFVVNTASVLIQAVSFKTTGRRVFPMTPLHHTFELKNWPETTIVVRFWIISALLTGFGFGLFYADWLTGGWM
jgi:phospho-N-acetylmuramoyl-pentapeptide-transferase